jgi:hypothetical protein
LVHVYKVVNSFIASEIIVAISTLKKLNWTMLKWAIMKVHLCIT